MSITQFIKIIVEFSDKNNCIPMWSRAADPPQPAWEGTADIPPATADPPCRPSQAEASAGGSKRRAGTMIKLCRLCRSSQEDGLPGRTCSSS